MLLPPLATTQSLNQVDLTTANVLRLLTIGLLVIAILEMVMMLSHYYWRIMPLRREVGEEVVAPPVGWTFAYHLAVTALLVNNAVGRTQEVLLDLRPTLATWCSPVILIGLMVVANRFLGYYSKALGRAAIARQRERNCLRQEPPDPDDL